MSEGRKFQSWQGEDLIPEYDFTDPLSEVHVVWEEVEVGGRAWRGESDVGTVPLRDERGRTGNSANLPAGLTNVSLAAHNRWRWSEQFGALTMARGWIGPKDYMRDLEGGLRADRYREVRMSVLDANEQLKGIIIDANRPSETDVARVQWIRSTYLSGSPRPTTVISDTYVSASNTVTLPEQRIVGDPRSALAEVASFANKEVFVTVDEELFYDGWDSTVYPAGLRISDRLNEITVGQSSEPASSVRLYPANHDAGGSQTAEAFAAPNLAPSAKDAAWGSQTGDLDDYRMMYDAPVTASGARGWDGVNVPPKDICNMAYMHRLDGDLLSIIQTGGVVRGQMYCSSRHGIGINEASQENYSNFCVRIYRPGTGFVTNIVEVGDSVGTVKYVAQSNSQSRTFGPATFDAYPSAQDGDYVVVELGDRHVGPTSGGAGGSQGRKSSPSASDLPIDNSTFETSGLNTWWQFGPPAAALPTFPPIWDVGPASTEDGQQLLSGVRMYYGQGSNTYVYVNSLITANQYAHYEESLTAPANITTAAAATTLATAVLNRRRTEDRNINVSIGPLNREQAALVKYGQLIPIKARAIAYADDQFFSGRIRQLRWTTPVPGMFFAHMQIERPIKDVPYGVGNRAASEAVTAHVLQGSNAHPEFVQRGILTTQGDLPYRGASDWTRLPIGTNGEVLTVVSGLPSWEPDTGGGTGLPWFSVTDYGAVGDGTTNDTTAINDAIAAYNTAGGGVLYFPAGHYQTTGALTSIAHGGLILGDGHAHRDGTTQAASRIDCSSATASLFTIASHAVTMRGLTLVNDSGSTPTAGAGITVTSGGHARYENLSVSGFFIDIDIQDGEHWAMSGCYLYNSVSHGLKIRHVDLPDGGDWSLSDMWVTAAARTAAGADAIRVESAGGGKIVNVKVNADAGTKYTNGLGVAVASGVNTSVLTVTGNSFENVSGHGISITSAGTGQWRSITIVGNQFGLWNNNSGKAINIAPTSTNDVEDIVIAANLLHTNGTARTPIQLTNTDNVTLSGNTLAGNFFGQSLYTNSGSTNIVEIGGGSDHGGLAGLSDDDHTHYLNETRHDALDHTGLTGVGSGSGLIPVDVGTVSYDTSGTGVEVTVETDWGISGAVPYYDATGAAAGEEAALFYDPATGTYSLVPYDF